MDGKTPAECALTEAWEEAGVVGTASDNCLGVYSYVRMRPGEEDIPCLAMVYPVKVKSLKKKFPEAKDRQRKWVSRKRAAEMISERELSKLIIGFRPPKSVPLPAERA